MSVFVKHTPPPKEAHHHNHPSLIIMIIPSFLYSSIYLSINVYPRLVPCILFAVAQDSS